MKLPICPYIMMLFEQLIQKCDTEIRAGRPQIAAHLLTQLNSAQIPREWRFSLAKICRRAGLYSRGLRILTPVMYPRRSEEESPPSAMELAEYSILLIRNGEINEAVERLLKVNVEEVPEALLYRAIGHFMLWEFRASVPILKEFVARSHSPHDRLVGRMNLAHALVEMRAHSEAVQLLDENLELAKELEHLQLQNVCHVFRSQSYLQNGDLAAAEKDLARVRRDSAFGTNDQFLVRKWEFILKGLKDKDPREFESLKEMARGRRDWEALRDADFFSLKVNFDLERYLFLFFGSPFPDLRERIHLEFGKAVERNVYVLGKKQAPRFDLASATIDNVPVEIAGGKCHQLMDALLLDFYRPLQVAGIFSKLYDGEYFNHRTSPKRVQEIVRRTRKWLASKRIPVQIVEDNGFYSLEIQGDFSFRVQLNRRPATQTHLNLVRLEELFSNRPFSNEEASRRLGLSTASVQRILNWAIQNGTVERLGDSKRATTYRVLTNKAA